ncbi:MAG: leucine-rich repeat domain-containing protein [Bacteroidaceae bacterium]|nr:leucine-rich repeat domain-containing protein [Bacteroidaceae bacterium]
MDKMKYWLTTMAVLLCSITASASIYVEIDGIWYNLYSETEQAEVTNNTGSVYSGSITIPATVSYEGVNYSVTSIRGFNFSLSGDRITDITIPESVTSIGYGAFSGCENLTSITIPKGVTSIEDDTFRHCRKLTTINIPEGVTSIGEQAFYDCSSLTDITIPKGVTSISSSAFEGCSSLTSVTCEAKIPPTTVGNTFNEVSKSIPVYVPANSVEAYKSAEHWSEFTNIQPIIIASGTCGDNLTWELTDDGKLTIEGTGAMYSYGWSDSPLYSHHEFITEVVFPAGVTNIGEGFFWDCTGLTEITIPAGVTSIDNYAFPGCRNLVSVSVPESVNSIGAFAFQSCEKLIDITIPEGVNSILNHTFQFCNSLASITIPAGVTSIGSHAFWGCSGLTSIICNAVTPPAIADEWTINEVDRSIPVYVPTAAIEDYKSAQYWSEFTNYQSLVIASGICGDNLTWKLTDDGELTIEGEGAMFDFQQDANRPSWDDYQGGSDKHWRLGFQWMRIDIDIYS